MRRRFLHIAALAAGCCVGLLAATQGAGALAQPGLQQLPDILRLQLSQQPAWRTYRDAAAQNEAEGAHEAALAAQLNALDTPARLDALRQQLGDQQQAFERQAAATVSFYAVLSPEQRRIFDDVTRLPTPPSPGAVGRRGGAYGSGGPPQNGLRVPPSEAGLPPLHP